MSSVIAPVTGSIAPVTGPRAKMLIVTMKSPTGEGASTNRYCGGKLTLAAGKGRCRCR